LSEQVDDFLDMRKVHETADALRRLYAANGFLRASIVPQVRFKEGLGVSVPFQIVEGFRNPSELAIGN
jgi:outer membrane protein assembly factor BamA